jgi:hypothetical protein
MEVQKDRAASPPDHEDDRDVSEQGTPIVGSLYNSNVEDLVAQHAAYVNQISQEPAEAFEERFSFAMLAPRMRRNVAAARTKRRDEMRRERRNRPPSSRMLDQHEDSHQSRTS